MEEEGTASIGKM